MSTLHTLLKDFSQKEWTGEIEVTSSQGSAHLVLNKGKILWAHRSLPHVMERLQSLSWLKLPPREILSSLKSLEQLLLTILKMNPQKTSQFLEWINHEREECFYRIFFWNNVEITPYLLPQIPTPSVEFQTLALLPLDHLLKEAAQRQKEWKQFQEKLGSSLRIFIRASLEKSTALDPLTVEEKEILNLCNGHNTIQDIIRVFPDKEFIILGQLYRFLEKKIIVPKDEEERLSFKKQPFYLNTGDLKFLGFCSFLTFLIFFFITLSERWIAYETYPYEKVAQALEIYRMKEKSYPVTLKALEQHHLLTSKEIELFSYTLIHPTQYEIKLNSK